MTFNKGEWSELYVFLYVLKNPKLCIIDENLKIIDKNIFTILELILDDKKFIIKNNEILRLTNNKADKVFNIEFLSKNLKMLIGKILAQKSSNGSFAINESQDLLKSLFDGKKLKANSKTKADLQANVLDKKISKIVNLNYNIKSNLGSPATLLNASNSTNFIYEIFNINDEIMEKTNNINSKRKLLDRYNFLLSNEACIEFTKVENEIFYYNLRLIDSNLDKFLAKILLLSYKNSQKDILKLINLLSKSNHDETFYRKKIGDFANAVTFGMRAGERWNGENEVKGGILLVEKSSEVYLLDLIYFKKNVDKYLLNNIKLDSPSSGRYKMFEIYKEHNRYFFKLNLQIRFK